MNASQPGDRVGAFLYVKEDIVYFLGYGTYVGDEVPPPEVGYLPDRTNPKIVLDAGDVVWGCECWWGPRDEIANMLSKSLGVKNVSIEDARRGANKNMVRFSVSIRLFPILSTMCALVLIGGILLTSFTGNEAYFLWGLPIAALLLIGAWFVHHDEANNGPR